MEILRNDPTLMQILLLEVVEDVACTPALRCTSNSKY